MASIDLGVGYDDIKNKVEASKQYTSLKNKYDKLTDKKVESFENFKGDVTQSLDNAKEDVKRFQKKIKSQFDQLLDITKITGGEIVKLFHTLKRLYFKRYVMLNLN